MIYMYVTYLTKINWKHPMKTEKLNLRESTMIVLYRADAIYVINYSFMAYDIETMAVTLYVTSAFSIYLLSARLFHVIVVPVNEHNTFSRAIFGIC